ncbi:MAG: plasmid mobilization relaxosome protein MobC [Ruminococcaceae bacterium]|nr:plasmid mobilization relaxosome protein MobC [Oscillospiraceae bacterium]
MPKKYNTPHRSVVVKTRLTEEEHTEFLKRLSLYNMSQAEFIRQAIEGATIKPIIRYTPVNDEVLATLGKLIAEYGKIGSNINQIARALNEWRTPYPQLASEITAAASDLAALKYEVLKKVGEMNGYVQTYQL